MNTDAAPAGPTRVESLAPGNHAPGLCIPGGVNEMQDLTRAKPNEVSLAKEIGQIIIKVAIKVGIFALTQ